MRVAVSADATPLGSVIVGYGRAGRELHHRVLHQLYGRGHPVAFVDPAPVEPLHPAQRYGDVRAALAEVDVSHTAFHVTTPPSSHLATTRTLVAAGARQLIVEKPVASTAAEARELCDLAGEASVLGVTVWPNSTITERVRALVDNDAVGPIVAAHFEQSKPRFSRSAGSASHDSAFEVELPHQVLLVTDLLGPVDRVLTSRHWPMELTDRSLLWMGGAVVRLEHPGGVVSTLVTDLTSPVRRRRLRLTGTRGEVTADYPIGSEDAYGQIRVTGSSGAAVWPDEPLTQFVAAAYDHFAGRGQRPPGSDLGAHARSIDVLERARAMTEPIRPSEREHATCNV